MLYNYLLSYLNTIDCYPCTSWLYVSTMYCSWRKSSTTARVDRCRHAKRHQSTRFALYSLVCTWSGYSNHVINGGRWYYSSVSLSWCRWLHDEKLLRGEKALLSGYFSLKSAFCLNCSYLILSIFMSHGNAITRLSPPPLATPPPRTPPVALPCTLLSPCTACTVLSYSTHSLPIYSCTCHCVKKQRNNINSSHYWYNT